MLTYAGIFIAFMGFAAGLFFILWRLLKFEQSPTGFTTLAALITFLGGVQLIGIGVLGIRTAVPEEPAPEAFDRPVPKLPSINSVEKYTGTFVLS